MNYKIRIMKGIVIFLIVCMLISCNGHRKQPLSTKTKIDEIVKLDSVSLDSQIKNFETTYSAIIKTIGDSVSKFKEDWGDFSEMTYPLERKYNECGDELGKTLLGYKLAANYLIHYDSSKKVEYKQKAEPLFYSFISFKDGLVASRYLKLNIVKVQFIQKEWHDFSEADKETLMFYGLLRGFGNGLPDVLKNVE
jgi:hypothetical protein